MKLIESRFRLLAFRFSLVSHLLLLLFSILLIFTCFVHNLKITRIRIVMHESLSQMGNVAFPKHTNKTKNQLFRLQVFLATLSLCIRTIPRILFLFVFHTRHRWLCMILNINFEPNLYYSDEQKENIFFVIALSLYVIELYSYIYYKNYTNFFVFRLICYQTTTKQPTTPSPPLPFLLLSNSCFFYCCVLAAIWTYYTIHTRFIHIFVLVLFGSHTFTLLWLTHTHTHYAPMNNFVQWERLGEGKTGSKESPTNFCCFISMDSLPNQTKERMYLLILSEPKRNCVIATVILGVFRLFCLFRLFVFYLVVKLSFIYRYFVTLPLFNFSFYQFCKLLIILNTICLCYWSMNKYLNITFIDWLEKQIPLLRGLSMLDPWKHTHTTHNLLGVMQCSRAIKNIM